MTHKQTHLFITVMMIITVAITTFIIIKHDQQQVLEQEARKIEKKLDYNRCIISSNYDYNHDWNAQCFATGKSDECSLNNTISKEVEDRHAQSKDICLQIYKAELNSL